MNMLLVSTLRTVATYEFHFSLRATVHGSLMTCFNHSQISSLDDSERPRGCKDTKETLFLQANSVSLHVPHPDGSKTYRHIFAFRK